MRVLLADDEPDLRSMMERMFDRLGHRVESVGDGLELVRRARIDEVDLVVSDIDMPGCDGIRAGKILRAARPGLRLVLMTGDPESARAARAQGFPVVLLKPFSLDELTAVLSSF
ncbi:MAG: response regulator [Elusimicrobia bacterium]|nr:response regulator [Elusimicrobiota bacterium]